ncbi:MAG: ABC transporter substrate-binding protein [Actinomycetota bacterium]
MSRVRRLAILALPATVVIGAMLAPITTAVAVHPQCFGLDPTAASVSPSGALIGTSSMDVIIGTEGDDVIDGKGGGDHICGRSGNDKIEGGTGDDEIDGGAGNDRVKGGAGADRLSDGTGDDKLIGGADDDLLLARDGTDTADGGDGVDVCDAESTIGCEAARKRTIVVGETFAVPPTNPAVNTNGSTHAYWEAMYNGLIGLDQDGNPVPELSPVVPTFGNGGITDGGRTYTLTLRDDVRWHDGVPLEAADVKFTFEKALLPFHARARNMAPALQTWDPNARVASIDVVDVHTVRFRFSQPYAPLLRQLNVTEAPIIPKHKYEGLPASAYDAQGNPTIAALNANTMGTGAFVFDHGVVNGPDAKVVRNADYFRSPLPYIDEIVMKPYPIDADRYHALLTGAVDWLWDVPNENVASLASDPNFRTAATQSLGGGPNSIDQFIFNLTVSGTGTTSAPNPDDPARYGQIGGNNPTLTAPAHPILGGYLPDGKTLDPNSSGAKVRRAISHAIDREAYLNIGRSGIGTVATAPISSELTFHADDIDLPGFDPALANQLLDEAGWGGSRTPEGFRTSFGHPTLADGQVLSLRMLQGSLIFTSRSQHIKSDLAAVGISLQVEIDTANASARVFTHRNFDTYILNYAQGYDPHVGVRRQYHSDQVSTTGTPNNAPGYKNPLVDADFDQAVQTLDSGLRFSMYHDAQERVAADMPYVWLIETPNVRGFIARCKGLLEYTGQFAELGYCGA